MPTRELPRLVEEALHDMAACDAGETMAGFVRERLPLLKKQARSRNEAIVNRGELAIVITGDAAGRLALASAYAQALHGFEITAGRDDAESTVLKTVQWRNIIADEQGNPLPFRKASDKLYSAKSDAEGGVLVIENIYDLPPNAANENAVAQAQNGAFQMLADLLTEYAERDYTPVIVLTGEADKMQRFLAERRGGAAYFTNPVLTATAAAPPPAPDVPAATMSDVTVTRPLKLKKPGL
ncbi:MAG: hypothetical protein EPN97_02345 [Alphaproteobacteria bacterium]|nr:MAG: hypothetical protein EPN97_02345 [Alphaproteobacteria bacterium]